MHGDRDGREDQDGRDDRVEREDGNGAERWPDPRSRALARHRLAVRLTCSFAAFLVLVYLTRGFLAEASDALWPPTDPLGQWATLVLLHAFGYVLLPLMAGSFVADVLAERL